MEDLIGKARAHDEHPTEMFTGHLASDKHKKAVSNKTLSVAMLSKGNIKAQITTGGANAAIELKERNRCVIIKFIKTVYFMARKKWAVKNYFQNLIEFIKDLGDDDLRKHFANMGRNATYLSSATVDELIIIISDFIEERFMRDLIASGDFALLTDESTDEAGRAQMSVFTHYIDSAINSPNKKKILYALGSWGLLKHQNHLWLMNKLQNSKLL